VAQPHSAIEEGQKSDCESGVSEWLGWTTIHALVHDENVVTRAEPSANAVLAGGGELGQRMREIDWAATPLGPVSSWPHSLRTCVRIMLTSRQPMFVWWGDQLINLYNDAYISILGGKHPAALGKPASEVWSEIWDAVGPRAMRAMRDNEGTFDEALLLIMERNGYREETYYTFSYSPVLGDAGGPAGILCANSSDTQRMFGERQQALLREVAARTANARTAEAACELALDACAANRKDLPFAMLYLVEARAESIDSGPQQGKDRNHPAARAPLAGARAGSIDSGPQRSEDRNHPAARAPLEGGDTARLEATAGILPYHPLVPGTIVAGAECRWPVTEILAGAAIAVRPLDAMDLPCGAWDEPPSEAVAIPVRAADGSLAAVLVIGRNPFRLLDDDYRRFLDLLGLQIASAIANARTFEEQRRRAEALAELDRAKTTFFSNISHEFRTPLTLMLGPTEDALRSPAGALDGEALRAVHRNELRLLKLVNALLDFSRIEAGRLRAHHEPTDVAQFTRELASAFRSAMDRAGLAFEVDCAPSSEPVSVDRGMWEKIVLNLLSNALKFTFEGSVALRLAQRDGFAELSVEDTGTGIPADEIPRLFERFHRVEGARARTHEGSGIGLALTAELVKLHDGVIQVESEVGRGTRFTVRIPTGTVRRADGPPPAPSAAPGVAGGVTAFVEEALRWLPGDGDHDAPEPVRSAESSGPLPVAADRAAGEPRVIAAELAGAHIVVADDNADMRDYLGRLLGARWKVTLVSDGARALEAARRIHPDLILTDIMMPNLDGFGLLRALRADPALISVPVVMLSARAGEEARIEGIEAGADDYLIKPFSARELIARVSNMLQLARLRREAIVANRAKDEFLAMLGHELRNPLAPILTALELMRLRGGDLVVRERTIIERQTQHLASLVEDLLDVSRIARGMVQLKRERLRISDAVAKAVETAAPLFEQQRHALSIEVGRDLVVDADPARLTQVFANLLTNAAKYTDPGGRVVVAAVRDGDDIIATVTDTGCGVAADMLPRVFDLFVQERQSLDRSRGGLGLGLAIVRNLVELHGGQVGVASPGPGQGTTFTVRLPRAAELTGDAANAEADADAAARAAGHAVSVLVVDDNVDAALLLADLLTSRGYATEVAHDAPEVLRRAGDFVPDVALLDIGLPAMDGYELARRLRELPGWRNVRMLALTGYGQNADRARSLDAGFDQHLVKPIDFATLERYLPGLDS
jgi:signal transduction histidine kinase/PAS domain-containing protein